MSAVACVNAPKISLPEGGANVHVPVAEAEAKCFSDEGNTVASVVLGFRQVDGANRRYRLVPLVRIRAYVVAHWLTGVTLSALSARKSARYSRALAIV